MVELPPSASSTLALAMKGLFGVKGLQARAAYGWRSLREGLAPLWSALQLITLFLGGSALAYVVVALDDPLLAVVLLLLGILAAAGEGAFRLSMNSAQLVSQAKAELSRFEQEAPRLTFGRALIPRKSQPYELQWGDGESIVLHGRVIRIPVENASGAQKAEAVQARLIFQPKDIHSSWSPKHPVMGEWDEPGGPTAEVDLPGNGSPRYLEILFIRDRPYPHAFVWTRASRGATLAGFGVASNRIEIEVEVTAEGPSKPMLRDTLIVECRPRQMLVADWASRNRDEEGNNVEWWDGEEM